MSAKHLTKNAISHKLVFLAAVIALAIIAAFSICATSQARAETNAANDDGKWQINVSNKVSEYATEAWQFADKWDKLDDWSSGENAKNYISEGMLYGSDYCKITSGFSSTEGYYYTLYFEFYKNIGERIGFTEFDISTDTPQINFSWYLEGWGEVPSSDAGSSNKDLIINAGDFKESLTFAFSDEEPTSGVNISGHVWDGKAGMFAPGKFVQYCQWSPWFMDYVPVFEEGTSTWTGFIGEYTLEGITEEMLPGKVFVYDGIKQIGESEPIWFFPEDMETLYMWPIVVNQEQPDPPVPPTPPDPPVPPGPVPPEPVPPVPPVPPTPVPTPDNPGGGIAQTGDATPFAAVAVIAVVAALGCGITLRKETWRS